MRRRSIKPTFLVAGPVIAVIALALVACIQPRPALVFSPAQLADAQPGQAYEARITISDNATPVGDIYVSEGQLPQGLTLTDDHEHGQATIAGTPTQAGQYTFSIGVWCLGTNQLGQTGQQAYTLTVR
jgi:hypothetical protein